MIKAENTLQMQVLFVVSDELFTGRSFSSLHEELTGSLARPSPQITKQNRSQVEHQLQ